MGLQAKRRKSMDQQVEPAFQAPSADRGAYSAPVSEAEVEAVKNAILAKLTLAVGRSPANASNRDWFVAAALAARDHIVLCWMESNRRTRIENRKRVYYLSLEFLIGRQLRDVLHNLELTDTFNAALGDLGVDLAADVPGRAGRGTGQWRPGPASRVLHGKPGDAVGRRVRLRHPL
jgi:hypothetical protein